MSLVSCFDWIMEDFTINYDYVQVELNTSGVRDCQTHAFEYILSNKNKRDTLIYLSTLSPYLANILPVGCLPCYSLDSIKMCKSWKEYFEFLETDSIAILITKTYEEGYEWAKTKNDSLLVNKKVLYAKEMYSAPMSYFIDLR